MTDNPYTSPELAPIPEPIANAPAGLSSIARPVFLAWEKLRIAYIAVLGSITLAMVILSGQFTGRMMQMVVEGALAANILYFAGPTVETYVRWLGYDKSWPRWLMFACGTLLSIVLAFAVLSGVLLPAPD